MVPVQLAQHIQDQLRKEESVVLCALIYRGFSQMATVLIVCNMKDNKRMVNPVGQIYVQKIKF